MGFRNFTYFKIYIRYTANLTAVIEEISNFVKSISSAKKINIALNSDNLINLFGTEKMVFTLWLNNFISETTITKDNSIIK